MSLAEIDRLLADLQSNSALRAEAELNHNRHYCVSPLERAAAFVAFAARKDSMFTLDALKAYVKWKADTWGDPLTDADLGSLQADFAERKEYTFTLDELKAYVKAKAAAKGRTITDADLESENADHRQMANRQLFDNLIGFDGNDWHSEYHYLGDIVWIIEGRNGGRIKVKVPF